MRMEKKQTLKDDGRYLIYYHFPESATPEQAAAFADVAEEAPATEKTEALPSGRDRDRV